MSIEANQNSPFHHCPKCGGDMDVGRIVQSDSFLYYSDWQKKRFKLGLLMTKAQACLTCGFIEMYLDPEALKKKIRDNVTELD
ncbi:hypothetical protein C7293_24300 [filamentous cyanobacterium CCT1]|nr:hypothetical protein C7293_24300 [filamentous cyanobacterium CCT1]PSN79536.1 hypothetical protein C8B47_11165 [filamentous cyanobacterium CCP4]